MAGGLPAATVQAPRPDVGRVFRPAGAARSMLLLPAVTFATQNIVSGLLISAIAVNELRTGVR
jgi:hypothetical protein